MNIAATYFAGVLLATAILIVVTPAFACAFVPPGKDENRLARFESKPVVVDAQCGFINGGIGDRFSAGPALPLGEGRYYQVSDSADGVVTGALVGDCNAREVVHLRTFVDPKTVTSEDSCGFTDGTSFPLLKPNGVLTLKEGNSISELVVLAKETKKIRIDTELLALRQDYLGWRLPRKDRFDLLCGCKKLYPDSAGAKQ